MDLTKASASSNMKSLLCLLLVAVFSHVQSLKLPVAKHQSILSNFAKKTLLPSLVSISLLVQGGPLPALADKPLNAPTAIGTRVNSDAESLLRYGLPINNKEIRDVQGSVESIKSNLKTRRINFAQNDVNNVKKGLLNNKEKILKGVPSNHMVDAQASYGRMIADLEPLLTAIEVETSSGSGSVQQRASLDNANRYQDVLAKELSVFEQLMVPDNFKRTIPEEYSSLPALQDRAEVLMTIKKADGSQYEINGELYNDVTIKMVIDGYNAPLTGGNFVDLIKKGFYNNKAITRSDGFVVQTGDNSPTDENGVHGYLPAGAASERKIPLEISLKEDKELLYGVTSEDDGRGYAAAVLPFQSYGALGMARSEFEADSASSQFFWLLFESDLTPAGKNLLDGRYACFGYTVEGADLLKGVREGDIIASTKVLKGTLVN